MSSFGGIEAIARADKILEFVISDYRSPSSMLKQNETNAYGPVDNVDVGINLHFNDEVVTVSIGTTPCQFLGLPKSIPFMAHCGAMLLVEECASGLATITASPP